jgi:hypothetical protein
MLQKHFLIKAFANMQQWKTLYSDIQSFAFSDKWLDGFVNHNNLSTHCHITVAQYLPDDLIEKQQEF